MPQPRRGRWCGAVIGLAAVLGGTAAGTAWLLRDPLPHFLARRSSLVGAVVDSGRRLPVAVGLGGYESGRSAIRWLGDTRGVLVASLAYPFTGHVRPSPLTFVREIPKIRAAFLDTPSAVMLALDYLLRRADVDASRVGAVGVSLGAPFMCIAGALDRRFTRTWTVHGSGGSFVPLEMNMRRTIPFAPVRLPAAVIANVIIAGPRLDPVRWVGRIAPRPFVMVNAESDQQMPRAALEALAAIVMERMRADAR